MLSAAMDAPRFPLMRLPVDCSQNVLRILKPIQLFEISLASKKSKSLVQSSKIKASKFIVRTDKDSFSIDLRFPGRAIYFMDLIRFDKISYTPYSNEMDERTFINHLKCIFNTEKIEIDVGFNSEQFDFEALCKGRQDIKRISLLHRDDDDHRRILNIIKPSNICMSHVTRPRDILIQNIDNLRATDMNIRLEDLLIMNIKNLETRCRMVPAKVLNRFLKLWTHGSNLQMESLKLRFFIEGLSVEDIFDRLKITHNTTARYFKSVSGAQEITGGLDLFRFDGTVATILANKYGRRYFEFEMFVWHDHCIAKETDL